MLNLDANDIISNAETLGLKDIVPVTSYSCSERALTVIGFTSKVPKILSIWYRVPFVSYTLNLDDWLLTTTKALAFMDLNPWGRTLPTLNDLTSNFFTFTQPLVVMIKNMLQMSILKNVFIRFSYIHPYKDTKDSEFATYCEVNPL